MRVDELGDIDDPFARAQAAQRFLQAAGEQAEKAQAVRDAAVAECLADGWSVRKLAKELHVSPSRVQQMKPRNP